MLILEVYQTIKASFHRYISKTFKSKSYEEHTIIVLFYEPFIG